MESRPFRIEDGNENICGACLRSGTLICCDNCPAAFHPECAGYNSIDSVPDGDWFCFLCSRKLGVPFSTGTTFATTVGEHVMVACDEHNEVFAKAVVTDVSATHVTLKRQGRSRTYPVSDARLWRGTTDEASWTRTPEGEFRPNSRAFEIDFQQIASIEEDVTEEIPPPNLVEGGYAHFLHLKKREPKEKHFLDLLTHFWRVHVGAEDIQWPSFGYIVPLADLWDCVQKRGGFQTVCEKSAWNEIVEEMMPDHDLVHFGFVLKHMFQTVLLDVESNGGVEAMEIMKAYRPVPEGKADSLNEGPSLEGGTKKRRRRSRKKRRLPTADEWISTPAVPSTEDALTASGTPMLQSWPQVYSASRAVQEYRTAIGIVSLTEMARSLNVGDKVDVRIYRDSSLGPWRAARILTIATASAFEGYRRFRVKFSKSKDPGQFPTLPEEGVTLLARPMAWGTTLSKPSVLIRPPLKPYFPPVKSSITLTHRAGDRVEAWMHNGWWPATILSIKDDQALLQGDVIPLGEGLKWIGSLSFIRPAPNTEEEGYGMIEPLDMEEDIYPKEMEKRLNVTVDKTMDGHLILSFKRLDQRPQKAR